MSRCVVARPIARHLQSSSLLRAFSTTTIRHNATVVASPKPIPTPTDPLDLDPSTVSPEFEAALVQSGRQPVGSRRRRVAMRNNPNSIPFEQLPFQAFQEARKVLAADRDAKLLKIQEELAKISVLEAKAPETIKGGAVGKEAKLRSLRKYVEELKILADINDPVVKKRFEDGLG